MHILFKCQILRHGKGHLRGNQPFHHRIVRHVQEHNHMVGHAAFLKGAFKIFRHIIFYTHSGKNNSKFFVGTVSQRGLTHNLCRQLVMGKTVSGENRQLLPSDQCGQPVDSRNTCTDIVTGIFSSYRVQGLAVHVRPFSATISPRLSIGSPIPLKVLPRRLSESPISIG